jgi:predicted TIM-barrel fold metal-dependent hydrolase
VLVIDTHAHCWEAATPERPHGPGSESAGPPVTVENLLAAMDAAGVDKVTHITRGLMQFDNRYTLESAALHPDRMCAFGTLDPTVAGIAERLATWLDSPYMLGVRLMLMTSEESGWMSNGSMDAFWDAAERYNVPVALYAPFQVQATANAARRHPGLRLLVDHLALWHSAGPTTFQSWSELPELLPLPNVYLKASILPEATGERSPYPAAQQYMREIYERFGADRIMWGSNYPVCLKAGTYRESVDFVREACDFIPARDRATILGGTAARVLGLPWAEQPAA